MIAGSDGIGGVYFDNAVHAQTLGVVALIYILFAGGLDTEIKTIRPVIWQGASLATVGVLLTCGLTGWFAKEVIGLSWLEGLLLGAIVSSTDAAAVFTILRGKNVGLSGRIVPLLELESGANDPMAVLLTVGLLELMTGQVGSPWELLPGLVMQIVVGGVIGYLAGKGIGQLLNRAKLEFEGLYPVLTLSLVVFVYGLTQKLGGSGFLAVYLTGLFLGNQNFIHRKSLTLFHDGIAWLMQIAMFLALGLLVFPPRLMPVVDDGLLISLFLIFVARPVAVFISLAGSPFTWRQKGMVSWVGLRGSVPIILATYALTARIDKADGIFHLVFFIVLTSVLVQGTLITTVAKLLKVDVAAKEKYRFPLEYVPSGDMKNDLVPIEVPFGSHAAGKSIIQLKLPKEALIVLIQRKGNVVVPKGTTILEVDDTLLVLAEKNIFAEVQRAVTG